MTLDPRLLQALAAADSPPPPGADFGPTQLAAAVRRRTVRLFVRAAATLLVAAIVLACWPRGAAAGVDARAFANAELRALAADLADLRAALMAQTLVAQERARDDDAILAVRYELASARADARPGDPPGFANPETRR